jgi:hypothetical protein
MDGCVTPDVEKKSSLSPPGVKKILKRHMVVKGQKDFVVYYESIKS